MRELFLLMGIVLVVGITAWAVHEWRDLARIERQSKENSRAFHALADPVMEYLNEGNPWDEPTWQAWNRRRRQVTWRHRLIGYSIVMLVFGLFLALPGKKES